MLQLLGAAAIRQVADRLEVPIL